MIHKKNTHRFSILFLGLLLLNFIAGKVYERIDLTDDQRYSLSQPALDILDAIKSPIVITVYLEGKFPAEFKRLQFETRQLLEEFKSENNHIKFRFEDPIDNAQYLSLIHI